MIEDELRALLTDRAGEVPDNPARVAEVRSRVRRTKRRRTTGTALGLVLLALAGFGLTRLPGSPDALPTGVPPGPWFTQNGKLEPIPGWNPDDLVVRLTGPERRFAPVAVNRPLRRLVLVRCTEPGPLDVRNLAPGGPGLRVECSRPAGDRFEGAAVVEPEVAVRLWALTPGPENVEYVPGSTGEWQLAVLDAIAPDRLPPWESPDRLLLDGATDPAGGTVTVTIPTYRIALGLGSHFTVQAECVEGVRLTLTARGGTLGEVRCDQDGGLQRGFVSSIVQKGTLDRLGLRPGDRVSLTVRSTGRQTDQWRLVSFGR